MELELIRRTCTTESTIGDLRVDELLECLIIEPPTEDKAPDCERPAIPEGRYKIGMRYSEHFRCTLPLLLNVPGRSDIEIHWGNRASSNAKKSDTKGCLIPGRTEGPAPNWIGESRPAWKRLFGKIKSAMDVNEEVWITIKQPAREVEA